MAVHVADHHRFRSGVLSLVSLLAGTLASLGTSLLRLLDQNLRCRAHARYHYKKLRCASLLRHHGDLICRYVFRRVTGSSVSRVGPSTEEAFASAGPLLGCSQSVDHTFCVNSLDGILKYILFENFISASICLSTSRV